jgi:hypothetical protein
VYIPATTNPASSRHAPITLLQLDNNALIHTGTHAKKTLTHGYTRTHARTHARMHTHARTHAHNTHVHTHHNSARCQGQKEIYLTHRVTAASAQPKSQALVPTCRAWGQSAAGGAVVSRSATAGCKLCVCVCVCACPSDDAPGVRAASHTHEFCVGDVEPALQ